MDSVSIRVENLRDLQDAQKVAWVVAYEKLGPKAVLWSWYDPITGRHGPRVECCDDTCNKTAWELYAVAHGGNLKIQVESGGYEFFFGLPRSLN